MVEKIEMKRSRCAVRDESEELFFSLACYRNALFISGRVEKVIEFYSGFNTSAELIGWMKERPKGSVYIHEIDGNKKVIVVIPTANFNGRLARNCRDTIYKGLQIIFVESAENDPFFNYAYSCNIGVKKAMKYNPEWVIVSNDDVLESESVEKLLSELHEKDGCDIIFTKPEGDQHSYTVRIGSITRYKTIYYLVHGLPGLKLKRLETLFLRNFAPFYGIERKRYPTKYFVKQFMQVNNVGSLTILGSNFVKCVNGNIFDETYINGIEDVDLSVSIYIKKSKTSFIDFKLVDMSNSSLGRFWGTRLIRDFTNRAYFSQKLETIFLRRLL